MEYVVIHPQARQFLKSSAPIPYITLYLPQVPYLIAGKNHYHLNKRHDYYSQIQLQLWVAKLEVCDFVVWTPSGIYIENIVKDPTYCQILERAQTYITSMFLHQNIF